MLNTKYNLVLTKHVFSDVSISSIPVKPIGAQCSMTNVNYGPYYIVCYIVQENIYLQVHMLRSVGYVVDSFPQVKLIVSTNEVPYKPRPGRTWST